MRAAFVTLDDRPVAGQSPPTTDDGHCARARDNDGRGRIRRVSQPNRRVARPIGVDKRSLITLPAGAASQDQRPGHVLHKPFAPHCRLAPLPVGCRLSLLVSIVTPNSPARPIRQPSGAAPQCRPQTDRAVVMLDRPTPTADHLCAACLLRSLLLLLLVVHLFHRGTSFPFPTSTAESAPSGCDD